MGGVYNSGILATGDVPHATYAYQPAPQAIRAQVSVIEKVCAEFSIPIQAASLQFALMHPGVTCAVIGAEEISQVETNVDSLSLPVPPEFWQRLMALGLLEERRGSLWRRRNEQRPGDS